MLEARLCIRQDRNDFIHKHVSGVGRSSAFVWGARSSLRKHVALRGMSPSLVYSSWNVDFTVVLAILKDFPPVPVCKAV